MIMFELKRKEIIIFYSNKNAILILLPNKILTPT